MRRSPEPSPADPADPADPRLPRRHRGRSAATALAAAIAVAAGCAGGDDAGLPEGSALVSPGDVEGPCADGAERDCHLEVARQGRVVTCFDGVQGCVDGDWGPCRDGTLSAFLLPRDSVAYRAQALTDPVPCANNVCDPNCRAFYEEPAVAIETERGEPIFTWTGGTIDDLRAKGLVRKAFEQPCSSGFDCQFNYHCTEPITHPLCAHSKCEPGVGLDPHCEDGYLDTPKHNKQTCVGMICEADPSCCSYSYEGDCPRDPCELGTSFKENCDDCVTSVCAELPSCCQSAVGGADPIVFEAEDLATNSPRSSQAFEPVSEASASEGEAMQVLPDNGTTWGSNKENVSPSLDFDIDFPSGGTWYVWVRGRAGGYTSGSSNTVHIGIDGNIPSSAASIGNFPAYYAWKGNRTSGGGSRATISVSGGGTHRVHIWMSEDGFIADKVLLTKASNVAPTGAGPAAGGGGAGSWGPACVEKYAEVCDVYCGAREWDEGCIDLVDTVCDAPCPERPDATCAHSPCDTSGAALDARCHPCVEAICKASPTCCITGWSTACRNLVATTCGLTCPIEMKLRPPESGTCVPWLPGQMDDTCDGIDLAVGVPCSGTLPICNHGTETAPAHVRVIHFPGNADHYPNAAPDQDHPQMDECFTPSEILPGRCVAVTTCDLGGTREIMVNPPDTGAPSECSRTDNWGLYGGESQCSIPVCSDSETSASFRKVNLYFQVDKSGSMDGAKWTGTTAALKTFFSAPESAGLNVALEFFALSNARTAYGDGCGDPSVGECTASKCARPMVALGELTAASPDTQETKLVNAVDSLFPGGWTPTYPALRGAVDAMIAAQSAAPDDLYAVVLATDGEPTKCELSTTEIAKIALDGWANHEIRTYTIGMDGADISALNTIAQAGGTRTAFVVTNDAVVEEDLLDALFSISRDLASCEFSVANGAYIDPTTASVIYTSGSGAPVTLTHLASEAGCGEGWYFDNPADPSIATLCPDTCSTIQNDGAAQVSVRIGCAAPFEGASHSEIYAASCPATTRIQWSFFTWDTEVDPGAEIVFRARAAGSEAALVDAEWSELGRATSALEICGLGGPLPDCPRSLYDLLGLRAHDPFVELEASLEPSTTSLGGAVLNSWEMTYTCLDNE
ncbi:MAG: VWA domain-containing protein [Polyangiaceae bacterium]|nr:VWA domain-containing protein [Polyangiaceae bacterium]